MKVFRWKKCIISKYIARKCISKMCMARCVFLKERNSISELIISSTCITKISYFRKKNMYKNKNCIIIKCILEETKFIQKRKNVFQKKVYYNKENSLFFL